MWLGLPQEVRIFNMEVSEIYKQCYVKWEPKSMYLSVFNMVVPVVKKSQEGYKIKRIELCLILNLSFVIRYVLGNQ